MWTTSSSGSWFVSSLSAAGPVINGVEIGCAWGTRTHFVRPTHSRARPPAPTPPHPPPPPASLPSPPLPPTSPFFVQNQSVSLVKGGTYGESSRHVVWLQKMLKRTLGAHAFVVGPNAVQCPLKGGALDIGLFLAMAQERSCYVKVGARVGADPPRSTREECTPMCPLAPLTDSRGPACGVFPGG